MVHAAQRRGFLVNVRHEGPPGYGEPEDRFSRPEIAAGMEPDPVEIAAGMEPDPVETAARTRFGYNYLYPYQRLVIANTLEGTDQIVILPTGGGKSLCFQVASCFLEGCTVVVVPLLSLLHDHIRRLKEAGHEAGVLKGGQTRAERQHLFSGAAASAFRLIFATPEVLLQKSVRSRLKQLTVSHLVFDEAHCVSEWGSSFRPAYLEMGALARELPKTVITAFTATASESVCRRLKEILFSARLPRVVTDVPDRPNIFYTAVPTLSKGHMLASLCSREEKPLLVFSRSRTAAEQYARLLRRRLGDSGVYFYHAGLTAKERKHIEDWFLPERRGILTATSAYGMGVDKPDIRTVIHADVPPSVEAYLQESGRAGRDGKPSRAFVLVSADDTAFQHALGHGHRTIRFRRLLKALGPVSGCRRRMLLALLGHTIEHCFGCDFCRGDVTREPPAEKKLMAFFTYWNRRLTLRQAVGVLNGKGSWELQRQGYVRRRGFGMLADWEEDDIREALRLLCLAGKLRIPERGPFKKRIQRRGV
jgi:ATP-dependent DNA helicase RecQ